MAADEDFPICTKHQRPCVFCGTCLADHVTRAVAMADEPGQEHPVITDAHRRVAQALFAPTPEAVERVKVTAAAVYSVWQNDGRTHESNPRYKRDLDTAMKMLGAALTAMREGGEVP